MSKHSGQFPKGVSGNPHGRAPIGSRQKLLDRGYDAITRTLRARKKNNPEDPVGNASDETLLQAMISAAPAPIVVNIGGSENV